jgi:hypothetical protein
VKSKETKKMPRGDARSGAGRKRVTLAELIESGEWNWRNPIHRRRLEEEEVEGDEELAQIQNLYRKRIWHGRTETSWWAQRFEDRVRERAGLRTRRGL